MFMGGLRGDAYSTRPGLRPESDMDRLAIKPRLTRMSWLELGTFRRSNRLEFDLWNVSNDVTFVPTEQPTIQCYPRKAKIIFEYFDVVRHENLISQ